MATRETDCARWERLLGLPPSFRASRGFAARACVHSPYSTGRKRETARSLRFQSLAIADFTDTLVDNAKRRRQGELCFPSYTMAPPVGNPNSCFALVPIMPLFLPSHQYPGPAQLETNNMDTYIFQYNHLKYNDMLTSLSFRQGNGFALRLHLSKARSENEYKTWQVLV